MTVSASADQFGWQNIQAIRGGITIEPHRRWTVTAQYLDFWLASATDSLYNTSGGSIVRNSAGTAGTHIGEEVDAYTWYEINRHVNFGVGFGHILPGHSSRRWRKARTTATPISRSTSRTREKRTSLAHAPGLAIGD